MPRVGCRELSAASWECRELGVAGLSIEPEPQKYFLSSNCHLRCHVAFLRHICDSRVEFFSEKNDFGKISGNFKMEKNSTGPANGYTSPGFYEMLRGTIPKVSFNKPEFRRGLVII